MDVGRQKLKKFYVFFLKFEPRKGRRMWKTEEKMTILFLKFEPFRTKRTWNVKNWRKLNYDLFPRAPAKGCP